ncbi:MAG: hypothetical protein N4A48_09640 [Tepidibacter sp.]|jgi:hypothetical protein|nr:hypothetical protein [Tepidibacter sp.]
MKKVSNIVCIVSISNILYTIYSAFQNVTLFLYNLILCVLFTLVHIFLIKFLTKEKEQLLNNISEQQEDLIDNNIFINKFLLVLNLMIILSYIFIVVSLYGNA